MLARRFLAGTLVFGLAISQLNTGYSQEKEEKEVEKRAIAKWVHKAEGGKKIDDELKKKVMGQLKKSLKKFEKELGEKKLAGILKSVEQNLAGKMNEFHFEFDGVDAADLHKKMAEKLGHFEKTFAAPHMIQLHGGDRKMIGVMLDHADGKPVKIQQVLKGSAAEKAGIKEGDVVIKVNGKKIENPQSLSDHVQKAKGAVEIEIKRADEVIEVEVEPKKVSQKGLKQQILKVENLTAPLIKLGAGDDILEIHEDIIKKVAPKGKDGKAHGIFLIKPDDVEKKIELKIDRAAEDRKILLNKTDELKKQMKKRIEIRSDLGETIEKLQKQMKELKAEIKKLKDSKN